MMLGINIPHVNFNHKLLGCCWEGSIFHPRNSAVALDVPRVFLRRNMIWYCWWLKSCTTKDDDYPIIYRVSTIPGGWEWDFSHQQYEQIYRIPYKNWQVWWKTLRTYHERVSLTSSLICRIFFFGYIFIYILAPFLVGGFNQSDKY